MKGLTLEELSLQRVHEVHCYLFVDMCVEIENIALENYVKVCLHNNSGQWEKVPVFQRAKALRDPFVLEGVKVEEGNVYGS